MDVESLGRVLPALFVHESVMGLRRLAQIAANTTGGALSHTTYMVLIKDVISMPDTGCHERVVLGVVGSLKVPRSALVCELACIDKPDDYALN